MVGLDDLVGESPPVAATRQTGESARPRLGAPAPRTDPAQGRDGHRKDPCSRLSSSARVRHAYTEAGAGGPGLFQPLGDLGRIVADLREAETLAA
jgi:hypothetical protein